MHLALVSHDISCLKTFFSPFSFFLTLHNSLAFLCWSSWVWITLWLNSLNFGVLMFCCPLYCCNWSFNYQIVTFIIIQFLSFTLVSNRYQRIFLSILALAKSGWKFIINKRKFLWVALNSPQITNKSSTSTKFSLSSKNRATFAALNFLGSRHWDAQVLACKDIVKSLPPPPPKDEVLAYSGYIAYH